jgi:tetratricopeptide (TPR) repeat protein
MRVRFLPHRWRRRPAAVLAGLVLLSLLGWGAWWAGRQAWAYHHWRAAERADDGRDFAGALGHLACCRSAWPARPEVYLHSARAARRAGLLEEADGYLHECRRLGGTSPEAVLERLLLTAQSGGFVRVEESLRPHLRPGRPEFLLAAEVVTSELMRSNRLREAKGYLDLWLEQRPDDAEAFVRRGWVAEHLFDFESAAADYRRVLDLDPGRDAVRLRLAEVLVDNGRAASSASNSRQARSVRPWR